MKQRQIELFPDLPGDKKLLSDLSEFSAEFHPEKNGQKQPDDFTRASTESIWWLCQRGHEWQAPISNRTRLGNGCPYCAGMLPTAQNNLAIANPLLCKEWDYQKNNNGPEHFTPRSKTKVWWRCNKGHGWQAVIGNRNSAKNTIMRRCPYCANKKICGDNNFAYVYPEAAKEWHPDNNRKPEELLALSDNKVLWRCSHGHTWKATLRNRARSIHGCPECFKEVRGEAYRKATKHYNLQTENPTVCKEWHYEKNEKSPSYYMPASNDIVWWICGQGHEWQSGIYSEKRAKVGDALRGGISWRCSDAVNSLPRKGYATCKRLPSPNCPIHRDLAPTHSLMFCAMARAN